MRKVKSMGIIFDSCYSTISLSDFILPVVGQSFNGSKNSTFSYKKVSTAEFESALSSSPSISIYRDRGIYIVGYVGAFDSTFASNTLYAQQRPALFKYKTDKHEFSCNM